MEVKAKELPKMIVTSVGWYQQCCMYSEARQVGLTSTSFKDDNRCSLKPPRNDAVIHLALVNFVVGDADLHEGLYTLITQKPEEVQSPSPSILYMG